MHEEKDSSTLVVLDSTRCLIADSLDIDTSLTILGLISEDPSTWEEALSVWPRYRSPRVCEFPSSLPIEERDRDSILEKLQVADTWIVIDLTTKRVFHGGDFPKFGRDATLSMSEDEPSKRGCPMCIHLPPWWEYQEDASVSSIEQPRQSPIRRPHVRRDILYGEPFLTDIASRIFMVTRGDAWQQAAGQNRRELHPFTVAIHRDWLMTPRKDLGDRKPRELLHGAIPWIHAVTSGQELRYHRGEPMVAVPNDWEGYDTAPMGSQEMCMYFDLCREVIEAGWYWCQSEREILATTSPESAHPKLVSFLRDVKEDWLTRPFEGGSPPNFIIECDRRRVPRGAGVPIEGMDSVESEVHIPDCNCPICAMMADGMFGASFCSIDGHHLESDGEFAFSMHETHEEWEQEQREYDNLSDEFDDPCDDLDAVEDEDTERDEDPFASAWTGIKHDSPIPGDRGGYIKMAFMVSEIGMTLENHGASEEEIQELNAAFADYRRSGTECAESAAKLRAVLQSLSQRYPRLISKSADLQSRIDENARTLASNQSDPDDPF
jgi:hypothetical protein